MRKFVAAITAAILLTVSCVPMVAQAGGCKLAMHAHHHHAEAHAARSRQILWHGCIECGCGCHRSLDTLPHLLAPHAVGTSLTGPVMASLRTTNRPAPIGLVAIARIPIPPPQYI